MAVNYDPGPPPSWEALFATAPIAFFEQEPRFRTEFGPVYYRGRLDGTSRVLIIGQDPATDEILAQRTLVGAAGQTTQGLLKKLGLSRSYTMFNTFLYGIHGQVSAKTNLLSLNPLILNFRNALFDKLVAENSIEAILTLGKGARHAFENWGGGAGRTVFHLVHPTAQEGVTANWNSQLPAMRAAITPDAGMTSDTTPYGAKFKKTDRADIPRTDLNFGVPVWHGTQVTRSKRNGTNNEITWKSPVK